MTVTEKEAAMELRNTKRMAIIAARELGYIYLFDGVEKAIKKCKTPDEVSSLMCKYRRAS